MSSNRNTSGARSAWTHLHHVLQQEYFRSQVSLDTLTPCPPTGILQEPGQLGHTYTMSSNRNISGARSAWTHLHHVLQQEYFRSQVSLDTLTPCPPTGILQEPGQLGHTYTMSSDRNASGARSAWTHCTMSSNRNTSGGRSAWTHCTMSSNRNTSGARSAWTHLHHVLQQEYFRSQDSLDTLHHVLHQECFRSQVSLDTLHHVLHQECFRSQVSLDTLTPCPPPGMLQEPGQLGHTAPCPPPGMLQEPGQLGHTAPCPPPGMLQEPGQPGHTAPCPPPGILQEPGQLGHTYTMTSNRNTSGARSAWTHLHHVLQQEYFRSQVSLDTLTPCPPTGILQEPGQLGHTYTMSSNRNTSGARSAWTHLHHVVQQEYFRSQVSLDTLTPCPPTGILQEPGQLGHTYTMSSNRNTSGARSAWTHLHHVL